MNLRRRIERLECQFTKRPRYARAMEELSDTELYEILAQGNVAECGAVGCPTGRGFCRLAPHGGPLADLQKTPPLTPAKTRKGQQAHW